jgi:hypothetical protein
MFRIAGKYAAACSLALAGFLLFSSTPAPAQVHEVTPKKDEKLSPLSATVFAVPILPPSDANVAKPPANAGAYSDLAKLPDWTQGAWILDPTPSILKTDSAVPLKPEYAAKLATLRKNAKAGRAPGNPACSPLGMPQFLAQTGPYYEFLYAPGRVIMTAGNQEKRIIYTDNRKPNDPDPLFDGTSTGRWDKGDLVIETTAILNDVQTFPGVDGTGALGVSERIHQTGPDTLADDITLTDPQMFTAPYSYRLSYTRHRDLDVIENLCLSNGSAYTGNKIDANTSKTKETPPNPNPPKEMAMPAANAASLPGGSWESVAKLPDWFGPWSYDNRPNALANGEPIPTTPKYTALLVGLRAQAKRNQDIRTETYHCHPRGMPQMMSAATDSVFNFVFVPGRMDVVPENSQIRRIYTDGRGHPEHLMPSFNGHSIGHWESNGTILVVDTAAIKSEVQLLYGLNSSGNLHVTERFSQILPNKLQIVTTIADPVVLATPYTYTRTYTPHRDWEVSEKYCAQNNRDVDATTGGQSFNLNPPPAQFPAPPAK